MSKDILYHSNLPKALQRLRATPVFANLSDDDFRLVSNLLKPKQFAKAHFVISLAAQSELDLYVLLQGQSSSRKPQGNYVDDVQAVYQPGDVMNLDAFISGKDSAETIEALSPLEVWTISHEAFSALLEQQPELKQKLGALPDVAPFWAKQKRYPFVLDKGEVVVMYRRKHWYVLLVKLMPVVFMLLMGLLVWRLPVFMPEAAPFATLAVVEVWLFITLLVAIWQVNDWSDDFYAVTNRRVIHREKVLFFSNRQSEAPVSQIRNIVASRTSFIANSLFLQNMGDVNIETLNSYHPIVFANIDKPEEVSRTITRQADQANKAGEAAQRDVIRGILRGQMSIVEKPGNAPKPVKVKLKGYGAPPEELEPKPKPLPLSMGSFFFPWSRADDKKGNITYRHHPIQLLQTAGVPALSIVAYWVTLALGWRLGVLEQLVTLTAASPPLRYILIALLLAILLVLVVWLVFRYEDWRNDVFLLTKDKIYDIDRTPFALHGVKQNVTSLDKVQNVTSTQAGFTEWLFNMGDVTIETGGESSLVFKRVKDPRQIQRDIADYLAQFNFNKEAAATAKRHADMAIWLSIYHEMQNLPYDQKTFKPEK